VSRASRNNAKADYTSTISRDVYRRLLVACDSDGDGTMDCSELVAEAAPHEWDPVCQPYVLTLGTRAAGAETACKRHAWLIPEPKPSRGARKL